MKKHEPATERYVVCISNHGYEVDLALQKIYAVQPDPSAERSGWIRIVDETGEDYLYPEKLFQTVEVSQTLREELRRAS